MNRSFSPQRDRPAFSDGMNQMKNIAEKPSLLAPCGSYDALCAAISAGADEVYFGASLYNARAGAKNFSAEEFEKAIKLCRVCGVKSNITVNTLCHDREINDVCELVYKAACLGADAFIIQDLGVAQHIRSSIPDAVLHASTQCACHNRDGASRLWELGFSRIVLARELPYEDILSITRDAPYETEIFVRGALCVSHSGQCLFSSVVGGRSGNRGECAQPCRMEYCVGSTGKKTYPLSLRDLSLARNIKELCSLKVASLKLEGRMKSPEYVYGVTKIFKALLTEERNANDGEMQMLEELFTRGGFTDGYFTRKYLSSNSSMYGTRSDADKEKTRKAEADISKIITPPKRQISAVCEFSVGKKPSLSLMCGEHIATVSGEDPLPEAKKSGADFDSVAKNLTKFGNTDFYLSRDDISMSLAENVFVPASLVNDLRRAASDRLYEKMTAEKTLLRAKIGFIPPRNEYPENIPSVRLYLANTEDVHRKLSAHKNIESLVFPLECFEKNGDVLQKLAGEYTVGVLFPRVLFCDERDGAGKALALAKNNGASFCEISNIGHIDVVKESGLEVYGGLGLNITNTLSAQVLSDVYGISSLVLSPELKIAAARDMGKKDGVKYCFFARGRLPLMVLESCIVKACGKCKKASSPDSDCALLCDRMDKLFPVRGQKRFDTTFPCRNIIYNSVIADLRMKKELYRAGIDVICVSAEDDGMPM